MKWKWISSIILILFSVGKAFANPADLHGLALLDVQTIPIENQPYTRYISLSSFQIKDRYLKYQILSGHINHLSTEPDIVVPPLITKEYLNDQLKNLGQNPSLNILINEELKDINAHPDLDGALMQINIKDYGWSKQLWEKLIIEPFYHVDTEIEQWYGIPDGHGGYTNREKHTEQVRAATVWVVDSDPKHPGPENIALKHLLDICHTDVPLIDGQWFVGQTAIQADRNPGYYDFLGIRDEKFLTARDNFERLVGFDEKVVTLAKRKEVLEAVAISGVSQKPRRIGAFQAANDIKYFRTFDQFKNKAVKNRNPLNTLDDTFEHDAEEAFCGLPNDLIAWLLCNAQGKRQDSAPDGIGYNHQAAANDGRIHIYLACLNCHYNRGIGGDAGIMDLKQWVKTLFQAPYVLQDKDPEITKDLRQKYFKELSDSIIDGRRAHSRALARATKGLTSEKWAAGIQQVWTEYEEVNWDATNAAKFLDVTPDELRIIVQNEIKVNKILNTAAMFGLPKERILSIPTEQFEEVYPQLRQAVMRYKVAQRNLKGVQK